MNDPRLPERFWNKVSVDEAGCWRWTAARSGEGYSHYKLDGRVQPGHRVAYQALVGPIPEGLDIDHLCRVRDCVNPAHMEPVTRRVNTLRGVGYCAVQAAKTHCVAGHPFDAANTYTRDGNRACRKCSAAAQRRCRQRKAVLS